MTEIKQRDERYFEYVRNAWAALPKIEPRNTAVSIEILESWQRCVACGLEKSKASRNAGVILGHAETKDDSEATMPAGHHSFHICVGEHQAFVSLIELQRDGKQNKFITEEEIGTNAISLAYRMQSGIFVNGPEHYAEALHDQYSYAEPIFDAHRKMCCICCVTSNNYQTTVRMSFLVHVLSCIGNSICWMDLNTQAQESAIVSALDAVPQGVVYIDRKNVIKYFNRRALEVFGLKKSGKDIVIFNRCMALIWNVVGEGCQSAIVDYQDKKKEVNITAIPFSGQKYEKLFLLEEKHASLTETLRKQAKWDFDDIQTINAKMNRAKQMAATAAPYDIPIMLVGQSGVGKEMFAQSIHNASSRRDGPFVALNTSAIAPNLVESTLFGYERGAFTGASPEGKTGYFEVASGGTLFLDELDSIPFDVQTKLLRALSSKRIRRVGGTEDIPVDVRIISAGRVDVLTLIANHTFREDLYYRLSPVKIRIPSLVERPEDILSLTHSFLDNESKSLTIPCPVPSKEFMFYLNSYNWPGNVRELHNALRHALVFLEPGQLVLEPDLLPNYLLQETQNKLPLSESSGLEETSILKFAGVIAVCESFKRSHGNVEEIGRNLGVSVATVYNYMTKAKRYGLI